jgi:hypothetical protein
MLLFSYIMSHCMLFVLIYIACMVKGLIKKSHCQVNPSSKNEGQLKGWAILDA